MNPVSFLAHVIEHAGLTAAATGAATLLGLPCALLLAHTRAAKFAIGCFGALYTVPSLAYFAALVPLSGLGVGTALLVLAVYAFVLFTRAALIAIEAVPRDSRESAAALGLSRATIARRVELPLAAPAIFAGLRTTVVTTVAAAAIAAWVDGGGLGVLLFAGLRQDATPPLVLGAAATAALALFADGVIRRIEAALDPARATPRRTG